MLIDVHYQGEVFTVTLDGTYFSVAHGGDEIGAGFFSDAQSDNGELVWESKPRETASMPCDSGTLRALEYVILENMRPYCLACCERIKATGSSYCWPCEFSAREGIACDLASMRYGASEYRERLAVLAARYSPDELLQLERMADAMRDDYAAAASLSRVAPFGD